MKERMGHLGLIVEDNILEGMQKFLLKESVLVK